MKNNIIIGLLTIVLIILGCATFFIQFPFYYESIIIGLISIIIIPFLKRRTMFLYTITTVLVYGGYLATRSFIELKTTNIQVLYVYNHLLFTAFLLTYWVLLSYFKSVGYENERLQHEVKQLQRFYPSGVLTHNEFIVQAGWVLKAVERNDSTAWFVKLDLLYENKRVQKNLQGTIEEIVLNSIRDKFDLVTAKHNQVFIILRNTDEHGIKIVLDRIRTNARDRLNFIDVPFEITTHKFNQLELLHEIEVGD